MSAWQKWRCGCLIAAMALTGCAIRPVPVVTVDRPASQPMQAIRFAPPAEDEPAPNADRTVFIEKLASALGRHGIRVSIDAPVALTLAMAQRPAAVGITQVNSGKPEHIQWLSSGRKRRLLDACRGTRNEVVVTALRNGTAVPDITARGSFDACQGDDNALDALADGMARKLAGL